MNRTLQFLVVATVTAWPALSFACSVCFDANDETRGSYLWTTIFLSVFPLGIIFGTIYYLWRRARALEAEAAVPTPDANA